MNDIDPQKFGMMVQSIVNLEKSNADLLVKSESQSLALVELRTTFKVWLAIIGAVAGVVVPSIWAIVLSSILNEQVAKKLLSYIPFLTN